MKFMARLRAFFKRTPEPTAQAPSVTWHDEFERLRNLRAQRIELAKRPNLIRLPVREM
jgi:hypothetical protein